MGAFGRYHDVNQVPNGVDPKRTIPARIADVAQKLGGEITTEFFDGNFFASEKQVAAVFHDMFIALRDLKGDMPPELRAEISALTLEMSRILHDYSTPRSRAIFRKLWKKSKGPGAAKFGLTADAAEIAAQGAVMPTAAPAGAKARLQRVAAAQVGQVPQMSVGEEPSVTRSLRDELANRRVGDNVFDLQRFVDANGVFEGSNDRASIDLYGRIEYVGGKKTPEAVKMSLAMSRALERFLTSDIGFLADGMLDIPRHLNQFNSKPYKLTPLENRSEFGSPIQLRTNVPYRSRTETGLGQYAANTDMDRVIDSVDRLNDAVRGKLVQIYVEGDKPVSVAFPEEAANIIEARNARVEESRVALAQQFGEEFANAYMNSEEGIARFGKKEKAPKTLTFTPGRDIVVPEPIAAMIFSDGMSDRTDVSGLRFQSVEDGDFALRFTPVVSPRYIVLKNGTIVSARSAEGGLIEHRRVYPFKVAKGADGAISIEPIDTKQYRVTDPNQRYDDAQARETQRRFLEVFSADGPGFNDPSAGPLYEQVAEDIRTDAYAALEILAINGDRFPQLESELIASILEMGDFRVDRAPEYVKSRGGVVEPTEGSKTMKGKTLLANEAFKLPAAVFAATPVTSGTTADILHDPEVFGYSPDTDVRTYSDNLNSIVRGLRLLQKMSTIAGTQIGYGGIAQDPATYETEEGRRQIPRDNFWMLADRSVYDSAAEVSSPSTLDENGIFAGDTVQSEAVLSARAVVTGDRAGKAIEVIRGTDRAAILASRAAVEVARGLLGREWTIDLDPQFHRDRFPEVVVPGRSSVDERYYPLTRLLDSVAAPVAQTVISGGTLAGMRSSGALSSKSDKFFAALRDIGITIGTETRADTTKAEGGRTFFWDPEFGWTLNKTPDMPSGTRIGREDIDPRSQQALTVEMVKAIGKIEKMWTIGGDGKVTLSSAPIVQQIPMPGLRDVTVSTVESREPVVERLQKTITVEELDRRIAEIVKKRGFDSADLDPAKIKADQLQEQYREIASAAQDVHKRVVPVEPGYVRVYDEKSPEKFQDYTEEEMRKRKSTSKGTVYDAADGMEITSPEEYGYSVWDEGDEGGAVEEMDAEKPIRTGTSPKRVATVIAIALQNKGSDSAETAIRNALEGLDVKIDSKRALDGFFRVFWKNFSDITVGRNYAKSVELVKAIGANLPDNYVERALATDLEVEGKPALGVVSKNTTTGKQEVITVTRKKGKLVNAELVLPILENMQAGVLDGDRKIAVPLYEILADIFNVSVKKTTKGKKSITVIPTLEGGPMSRQVQIAIEAIRRGEIPAFDTEPLRDKSEIAVRMGSQGEVQAPSVSATGRPRSTSGESADYSYDDFDSGFWEGPDLTDPTPETSQGDAEINYSVKQGKLMGLLTPDRLLPKMSPGLRSFDMGVRTPVGGSVAGAAIDFATLGLSGNLNPQNALFTGALNATNLLTKSPLKATAIGAVASLGATAATGGDIGRTVFNLLGSIGGGALGAVATGGIGSLGGSVAGGFVADELWKALFGQGDNWSIRRQTSPSINTPDINVRVP